MIIDLTRIFSGIDKKIDINMVYSFDKEYIKNTDLLELNNVNINGTITKNSLNELNLNVDVNGTMILPCSITLKPVSYDFDVNIDENLEEYMKNSKNLENSIDILPIIWENILMEIPMKVVSEGARDVELKGDGWRLITDEKHEDINPAFAKLSELIKEK